MVTRLLLALREDELAALPAFDERFAEAIEQGDAVGARVTAACALVALVAACADFRQARVWTERFEHAQCDEDSYDAACAILVSCSAICVVAISGDTGTPPQKIEDLTTTCMRMLDRLDDLVVLPRDFDDLWLITCRAALEFSEQQGLPEIFHRIGARMDLNELRARRCALLPLSRFLVAYGRCVCRFGLHDPLTVSSVTAEEYFLLAQEIGGAENLRSAVFSAVEAQLLSAAANQEINALQPLLNQLHEALDYDRPMSVAVYFQHKARAHLMREEFSLARDAASHALRSAVVGACPMQERSAYHHVLALALFASDQLALGCEELRVATNAAFGRRRQVLECTLAFFFAWRDRQEKSREYAERLRQAMHSAESLNWRTYLNQIRSIAAQLSSDALKLGISRDFVKRSVDFRGLGPPQDADQSWPWPLRVNAFRAFNPVSDDVPLRVSGRAHKQIELLMLLTACGRSGAATDWIADQLWQEADGDAALHSLDVTVTRLRKLLGIDGAIIQRRQVLSLDPQVVWTDVMAFEDLSAEVLAEIGRTSPDISRVNECMLRLLTLYSGDLLAAETAQWVLPIRDRLRYTLHDICSATGKMFEQLGQDERARRLYVRTLNAIPDAEEFWRRKIQCDRRLGFDSEALSTYKRCVRTLHDKYRRCPATQTTEVIQDLIA